jgi:hypothetical protein
MWHALLGWHGACAARVAVARMVSRLARPVGEGDGGLYANDPLWVVRGLRVQPATSE